MLSLSNHSEPKLHQRPYDFGLRCVDGELGHYTAIRVSGVYPAGTRTHLFAAAGEKRPMEAYTEPEDIAEAVHFILTRKGNMWVSDMAIDHP